VWVRSLFDAGVILYFQTRHRAPDGGYTTTTGPVTMVSTRWNELRVPSLVSDGSQIEVRVVTAGAVDGGDGFLVDEATLYRPFAGLCPQ
jgi:hypothetical protein